VQEQSKGRHAKRAGLLLCVLLPVAQPVTLYQFLRRLDAVCSSPRFPESQPVGTGDDK